MCKYKFLKYIGSEVTEFQRPFTHVIGALYMHCFVWCIPLIVYRRADSRADWRVDWTSEMVHLKSIYKEEYPRNKCGHDIVQYEMITLWL